MDDLLALQLSRVPNTFAAKKCQEAPFLRGGTQPAHLLAGGWKLAGRIECKALFIETYNEDAEPFAWTKSEVHQRRVKGRRISEL